MRVDKLRGCGVSAVKVATAAAANWDILLSLTTAAALPFVGLVGAACTGMCLTKLVVVVVDKEGPADAGRRIVACFVLFALGEGSEDLAHMRSPL